MALEDRREAILARLLELAKAVDDTVEARRNESGLPDTQKYVVLFDGDEQAVGDIPGRRSATEPPPQIMEMTPEVQFRLAKNAKDVGTALNALRIKLIAAVATDQALLDLTVRGNGIRVTGSATVAERGRSVEGGIGVAFTFAYVLRPNRQV
ncbi:hypothetical protein [Mesorhizobium sp. M2A.F.Ca.ET.067.02.1.1]|uniref:hypothetical protein n=1 Tax=Mesorhizobium sp. M2A.F.Ca.ET.067.02.1.1 TaxID=2496749 RepID=UPI000FD58F2F|nr:hypothetical protein [Mesorhizobium sp. M2A.F.Ca.ET.067.02.1.1]RUW73684.1 hypothetical protein EOA28_18310 [Mesorhizobium sp. M2A.F.Ca.ET.067.02.1.1]